MLLMLDENGCQACFFWGRWGWRSPEDYAALDTVLPVAVKHILPRVLSFSTQVSCMLSSYETYKGWLRRPSRLMSPTSECLILKETSTLVWRCLWEARAEWSPGRRQVVGLSWLLCLWGEERSWVHLLFISLPFHRAVFEWLLTCLREIGGRY